ncbi:MAG: DUF4336 domain-containing protein [Aphanothece saxicola GSE-SYN-MK-01-06B]|jgi:hypothetical protein|nr:DUF4336 domain-containing protein [Aphanothece saxicola GSE-SYN-MK-01-06B]
MLRCLDNNIWVAEQPQKYFGLSIGTRMTVVRDQESCRLIVISPIKPTLELEEELSELGIVSDLVAPNSYHHLYCNEFKHRHPQAKLWGSSALKRKCPDLLIDNLLIAAGSSPWPGILICSLSGLKTLGPFGPSPLNEFAFCHVPSKTIVLTDSAFNFDISFPWLTRFTTRVAGGYNCLEPTILERLASTDKDSLRKSIQVVLSWDFDRVIVAHGAVVEFGGKAKLASAYSDVLGGTVGSV